MKKLLMGNEAIALAAIRAGLNFICGYPGTPSTEVLETVAKNNDGSIHVQWSDNEKVALEVGSGAAYAGARVMVTMKQVGLNVASDPLMCLSYIGIKGGMVILVADDPGPISSQTEQDTRRFGAYSKLAVFDPSSPKEAYDMVGEAFALSERIGSPVILRPTTRVCHACATIDISEQTYINKPEGFMKDNKWVIFPKLSYENHIKIDKIERNLIQEFSQSAFNHRSGDGNLGIVTSGISYAYVSEALKEFKTDQVKLLKIGTPNPFPGPLVKEFLQGLDQVLVIEELDPVLEDGILNICGGTQTKVLGKRNEFTHVAGEYSVELARKWISQFLNQEPIPGWPTGVTWENPMPSLPVRPPGLCAGCPHRASFYSVKKAMEGEKAVFCGDIGCYTLGNAEPLNMVDTCLCMGACITIAQGIHIVEPDTKNFAFVGDSTFFHSGIPGVINAVYNQTDITIIVIDNSTTAMTGHQPHPGTGKTMMGNMTQKIDIGEILKACGVGFVKKANPLKLQAAIDLVKEAAEYKGVSAIIFEAPCISLFKPDKTLKIVETACIGCKQCVTEIGCPAICAKGDKVEIDQALCYGCELCMQVCPVDAIGGK